MEQLNKRVIVMLMGITLLICIWGQTALAQILISDPFTQKIPGLWTWEPSEAQYVIGAIKFQNGEMALAGLPVWQDYVIEGEIDLEPFSRVSIYCRYFDESNWLRVDFNSCDDRNGLQIFENIDGKIREVSTYRWGNIAREFPVLHPTVISTVCSPGPGVWVNDGFKIQLRCQGAGVSIRINGTTVVPSVDITRSKGKIGIAGLGGGILREIKVTSLDSPENVPLNITGQDLQTIQVSAVLYSGQQIIFTANTDAITSCIVSGETGGRVEPVNENGAMWRYIAGTKTGVDTLCFTDATGRIGTVAVYVIEKPNQPAVNNISVSPGINTSARGSIWANTLGMEFVYCPAGEFMMGSPDTEVGRGNKEVWHRVQLTRGFYLGQYEVTQKEWRAVMGNNPSHFRGDLLPVEMVSWDDANEFCRKLSERTGETYRLPTEAEWEYACRAGSTTAFCFGDDKNALDSYAWYGGNSGNTTHPVGEKRPNGWSFYDMHGNVWEWCADWYGDYLSGASTDPQGASVGTNRVYRGGSWDKRAPANIRSAFRYYVSPSVRFSNLGFRLLRSTP